MILEDGSVTIFDGIEFNENLRWIDVLSDIAFLVMDLEDRAHPEFAHRFLNSYLEQTGDYEGLAVLRYYLAYRALVRAKVKSIRLGQKGLSEEARGEARRRLHSYIDLADRYAQPTRPRLIITRGVSGSGKTSGTQPLVDQEGVIRIRSDIERKRFFERESREGAGAGGDEGLYSAAMTRRTYNRLAKLAGAVTRAGFSVILDATFLERAQRDLLRRTAENLKVPFVILNFRAGERTLQQRVATRAQTRAGASDADLGVLSRQLKSRQPLSSDEEQYVIPVNTESPQFVHALLSKLNNFNDGEQRRQP
jgi:predicted kinase